MELFAKIVHKRLTIFVKSFVSDVGLGSEYASTDSNPLLVFSKSEKVVFRKVAFKKKTVILDS